MKIYYFTNSTTSRMVWLGAEDMGVQADYQEIDLAKGGQFDPAYAALNPSCLVPMLEDGDFRLTESSAILKYLAEKIGSPAYAGDIRRRARINEVMDWFNSNLYRELGYGLVYPQVLPHHRRPGDEVQAATVAWARDRCKRWLDVLDRHFLGKGVPYLCGEEITVADYFGAPLISIAELIRFDYGPWPNIAAWLARMKRLPSWPKVFAAQDAYAEMLKDQQFVTLA